MFKNYPIKLKYFGQKNKKNFKVYFIKSNNYISPWHDIPLYNNDNSINFICEIPKWTRAKMEINKNINFNPIKQDLKNNNLRYYKWGDMMFNYGALPQTWENPNIIDKYTNKKGDDDPLDAIEIGSIQMSIGQVSRVKVLCILGMIDEGETDWKVIVINKLDPYAKKLNSLSSIEKNLPGILFAIKNWLENYKTVDGKKKNKFAFDGKYKNSKFAMKIIQENHQEWKKNFN